ncbi:MAG: ABC transporter ATP-binding protein [Actinobacteria bacterium]|nr:ABC transporter ATP-binding protein [Actinomycetota bacterium]
MPSPDASPSVSVQDLKKVFRVGGQSVEAIRGVTFEVPRGESLAIVGESGSGKTTLARILMGLERPTSGTVKLGGEDLPNGRLNGRRRRRWAERVQMVFQDCYASLDPRQTARGCVAEALAVHHKAPRSELAPRAAELLGRVGLHLDALPNSLSGGQRQRVAIARALAVAPDVLILDEAVAALDVSVQGQVLNLLADIRDETPDLTLLFITHDLAVVRQVSDRVLVMERGLVVESGTTDDILDRPTHPYTKRLRESVPDVGWKPTATTQV